MRQPFGRMYLWPNATGDAANMGETRSWDREADIVVVGSGAAALAAALTASVGGASVVILEKSHVLGGTTAMSGAGTWVPANHHMLAAGMTDSQDEALTYLRATAPAGWQAEEDALWQSFVEHAPEMLAFVEANTPLQFELVHHPDLYVEAPGGKFRGRMVSPLPISRNLLGKWRNPSAPRPCRRSSPRDGDRHGAEPAGADAVPDGAGTALPPADAPRRHGQRARHRIVEGLPRSRL
jgi:hypothetical protein